MLNSRVRRMRTATNLLLYHPDFEQLSVKPE